MFGQVIPRSLLWLVSFCAVLIIGIIGCGGDDDDDNNEWGGTWAMETVDGQSLEQSFSGDFGEDGINVSITTNNWTFNDDGTMEAEIGLKIEAKEGAPKFQRIFQLKQRVLTPYLAPTIRLQS